MFTTTLPVTNNTIFLFTFKSYLISPISVYVFLGEHIALVDFIKCLQARKLLDTGNYVIISVDDEIYDPTRKAKIIRRGEWLRLIIDVLLIVFFCRLFGSVAGWQRHKQL